MPAQRADDFRILSVVNRDGVPQEIPERHMVPAIESEFSTLEGFDDLPESFGVLIGRFFLFCHESFSFRDKQKSPAGLFLRGCVSVLNFGYKLTANSS